MQPRQKSPMSQLVRPLLPASLCVALAPGASAVQSFGYIANQQDKTVSVLNLATDSVVETIDIPTGSPWSVVTHPDGSRVYVGSSGFVYVIDTSSRSIVDQVNLMTSWKQDLAISPDGSMLYAKGEGDFFSWEINAIDTTSNSLSSNAFALGFSDQISVSPDGTRVYETGESFPDGGSIAVRDAQTLAVLDQAPLGDFFYSVTAHPNGEWLFLGSHTEVARLNANTLDFEWRKTVSWSGQFENLLISTDGTRLYAPALGTGKTHVLDAATGVELGEIPLSGRGISQHPLGHLIYVVLQTNNRVAIVDANTFEVLSVVQVGDNPVSAGADFVTPILCGPSLYGPSLQGEGFGNSASLTAAGDGTTGSTLTLSYAQPPADASFAFSYVALDNAAAPLLGGTLLLDAGQLLFPTPGVVFSSAGQVLDESLAIAANPALVNLDVFLQAFFVELGTPSEVAFSNGVSLTICQP